MKESGFKNEVGAVLTKTPFLASIAVQEVFMPNENETVPGKNYAIASLVCGIVAVVFMWFGYGAIIGIASGVVGLILGIKANKIQKQGMATAGIVLSIIGLSLGALIFVACVVCVALVANTASSADLSGALQSIGDVINGLE